MFPTHRGRRVEQKVKFAYVTKHKLIQLSMTEVATEHALSSLIRLIRTKHHSTISVSIEFEKVWFWKVQVT
jgi:hypothetical protein